MNTTRRGHTPTPWGWVVHDHSMASLGVLPDPGLGDPLVLTVSPCEACQKRADPQEWKWGRCGTPSQEDAEFIVSAVNCHDELVSALSDAIDLLESLGCSTVEHRSALRKATDERTSP